MPKRKWLPVVLLFIAGFALSSNAGARTADKCLTKPNGPALKGQHWYYHLDHVHNRQCWHLREVGLPVHQQTAKTSGQPLPQAKHEPVIQAAPSPPKAAQDKWKEPKVNGHVSIRVAPLPWFDMLDLLPRPPAAQAAPPAAARIAQLPTPNAPPLARAADDPPPASKRMANGLNKPLPPAVDTVTIPVRKVPARRDPVQQITPQTVPRPAPAPVKAGVESNPIFVLSMLLFAGLAVAGPLFHIVRRRRNLESIAFRPPPWARVMRLNAPTPRFRSAEPPPSYPISPPLAPTEHTDRLAQALQDLAERLRTHPRPSIEPQAAGPMRPHVQPMRDRDTGRSDLADAYGLRGQSTTRRFS